MLAPRREPTDMIRISTISSLEVSDDMDLQKRWLHL